MHSGMKLYLDYPMHLAARFYSKTACDSHSKLPTGSAPKPKCRECPYWTPTRLASTYSGWNCHSSWQQCSTSSSFARSTCRLPSTRHTRTPHRYKTPPVGVQSQGTIARSSHAQSRHKAGTQFRREKNYNNVQAGTTFIPNRLQLI